MQVIPAVPLLQVCVEDELHAARRLVEVKFVLVRLEVEESIFSESELRFHVSVLISFEHLLSINYVNILEISSPRPTQNDRSFTL